MQELMPDGEGESSTAIQEAGFDVPVRPRSSTSGRTSIAEAVINFSQHSAAESSDRSKHASTQLHRSNQSSSVVRSDRQLPGENQSKSSIDSPGDLSESEAIAETYRREFEGLLEQDERGEPVDEDRLYFLELYARRWIGENLDEDEMRDLNEFEESESHRAMIETIKVATEKAHGAAETFESYEETACELPSILTEVKDVSEADTSTTDITKQGKYEETAGEVQQDSNAEGGLSTADLFGKRILEHDGTAEATTVLAANLSPSEPQPSEAGPAGKLIMEHEVDREIAGELSLGLKTQAELSKNIAKHEADEERTGELPLEPNTEGSHSLAEQADRPITEPHTIVVSEQAEDHKANVRIEVGPSGADLSKNPVVEHQADGEMTGVLPVNLKTEANLSDPPKKSTVGEVIADLNEEAGLLETVTSIKHVVDHDDEGAETAGELLTCLDAEPDSSGKLITNYEAGTGAAGQLSPSLDIEVDPVVLSVPNESSNSPVPMEPANKVKKMKLNFNVYEVDPPSRLDNLKVSTANKSVNSGSVLRNVDASLSRLQKGKGIHTNRIRRQLSSETGKLLGFLKPNDTTPKTSDPAVLIAHAGTKLQKRENLRKSVKQNPASRLYSTRTDNGSRRKARGRQNARAFALPAAWARRRSRATHSEAKEEKYIMRSSRDVCGEKLKIPGRAARAGRNRGGTLQSNRLQGSQHRSSAHSNRRKLASIIKNRHRSDAREEEAISRPPDVRLIPPKSNHKETAISASENSGWEFSTTDSATQQTNNIALTSRTNPIEETEIIKGATSSRDGMEENAVDLSDHFLSQLNKVDDAIAEQRGMSKAISVLQQNGGKLAKKQKRIHSSIRNERFLMATDLSYERIVKDVPRLELIFSIAEWRHVHALMLYARVFQCELAAENIEQPREFSIHLPDNLQVFEPLGVVLASIGVVEDKEGGVSYVPVAKPLQGKVYEPHNPKDVTAFMEWSQYKWNASWTQSKLERKRRKKDAENRGIGIPELEHDPNNRSKLQHWENLALEMWLGWDEELWFDYRLFVDSITRSFSFVDFPRSCTLGTYSWLIPSYSTTRGSYARIPNPSIGNAVWMIALLFDLCDLPSENTVSWFCKTDTIHDMKGTLLRFLDSAVKT